MWRILKLLFSERIRNEFTEKLAHNHLTTHTKRGHSGWQPLLAQVNQAFSQLRFSTSALRYSSTSASVLIFWTILAISSVSSKVKRESVRFTRAMFPPFMLNLRSPNPNITSAPRESPASSPHTEIGLPALLNSEKIRPKMRNIEGDMLW